MLIPEPVVFALLGLIIGSFLNVIIIRHNTGRSFAGRSGCMSCSKPLTPWMLIPVVSWIILKRRCAHCGVRISWQYPLVEIFTALLFIAVGMSTLDFFHKLLGFVFAALTVAIVAYDIRHTIMPDSWVYTAGAIAFVYRMSAAVMTGIPVTASVVTALSGPFAAMPFVIIWYATRGRGIGWGDAKFALAVGWLLGAVSGLYAVMLSFVIGAVVSVCILLPLPYYARALAHWGILTRRSLKTFTMRSEVPFGPFLAAGMLFIWISQLFGIENQLLTLVGFL